MKKKTIKLICMILTLSMIAFAFAGCTDSKKEAENNTTEPENNTTEPENNTTEAENNTTEENTTAPDDGPVGGAIAGGWSFSSEFGEVEVPEEAKAAFEKAMEGFDGSNMNVVAYLGSQVVAGTNYAFLCQVTPVVPNAEGKLALVKIYNDLEGNATVNDVTDIDLTQYAEGTEINFEELAGGFMCEAACGCGLNETDKAAFDKAMADLSGVGYEPLACLGTQVVAGRNLKVLCKATRVTAETATALAVVTVYDSVDGTASITAISGFEF